MKRLMLCLLALCLAASSAYAVDPSAVPKPKQTKLFCQEATSPVVILRCELQLRRASKDGGAGSTANSITSSFEASATLRHLRMTAFIHAMPHTSRAE